MTCVQKEKDIRIAFDSRLSFHDHMMDIVKASCRRLEFNMRHSRQFSNPLSLRLLHNALVRRKLKCNALGWNPRDDRYILVIEKVIDVFLRSLFSKEYG
jgi:hypothetical protein